MMPSSGDAPVKIPLDATPSFLPGIDVTPDGGHVYVAAEIQPDAAVIKVIDTAAKKVTTTIPVGKFVRGLAITPMGATFMSSVFAKSMWSTPRPTCSRPQSLWAAREKASRG